MADNILIACRKRTCSNGRAETPEEDAVGKYTYKLGKSRLNVITAEELVDEGAVTVGDMGHVQSFRDGTLHDFCEGDRDYLAPEILHDMQSSLLDPAKADVYSLGITLFETVRDSQSSASQRTG